MEIFNNVSYWPRLCKNKISVNCRGCKTITGHKQTECKTFWQIIELSINHDITKA